MSKKSRIYFLLFILGLFIFNQPEAKAESFLYSFGVSSEGQDLEPTINMNILTDINIDNDYTYLTHQIILSDVPSRITFENNIPREILVNIELSYKDANSSWNKILTTIDESSNNPQITIDTEGKKGPTDYQFNIIYIINTQSIFNLSPNILNSFDYLISSRLDQEDLATIKITLPTQYKPFDSAGWRLQGGRFFYSTVISNLEKNFYSVFYLEEDYGGSIDALKNEITKLTQENEKLTENIIQLQRSVENYRVENEELTWNIKDLKDELIKSKEEQQEANMNTKNFRYLSWGLTLSLPGMQFLLNELREKNRISPTQLHLGSVIGTFIVFMLLYVSLFL